MSALSGGGRPPVRLILSDLDGTLLRTDGRISDANARAIHKALDRGIRFGIATGRYRAGCRQIIDMLGLRESDICCAYDNGAHVVVGGQSIYDGSISKRDMSDIVHFLRGQKCTPALYISDNWIVEKKDYFYDKISAFYDGDGLILDFDEVLSEGNSAFSGPMKIAIRAMENDISGIYEKLRSRFPDYEYYLSSSTILEMNYEGKGKGNALQVLAGHFGMDLSETMALGDYDNDAGMIGRAGIGVAMSNASAAAKAAADFVTLSNDEDGLSFAIGRFCFPEEV